MAFVWQGYGALMFVLRCGAMGGGGVSSFHRLCHQVRCLHGGKVGVGRVTSYTKVTPDVLSSLCAAILPACFRRLGGYSRRRTLSRTVMLIGGVSGQHLLSILPRLLGHLRKVRPGVRPSQGTGPFLSRLRRRVLLSAAQISGVYKLCADCDLSSSSSYLGVRPFVVDLSRGGRCVHVKQLGTCKRTR